MYGCESWTVKNAERWRIGAFELWCWRRLVRIPWSARRSNQSILKEINPGISLEGMMLKLKLQSFGHLMRRVDGHESEWTPGVGDRQGGLACCDSWGCKESDTTERVNWTGLNWAVCYWKKGKSKTQNGNRPVIHKMYFGIILTPKDSSLAIETIDLNLIEGQITIQIVSFT